MQWPEPRLGPVRPRLDWQIEDGTPIDAAVEAGSVQTAVSNLGELPLTAELYWQLRQNGKPLNTQLLPAPRQPNTCRNGARRLKQSSPDLARLRRRRC